MRGQVFEEEEYRSSDGLCCEGKHYEGCGDFHDGRTLVPARVSDVEMTDGVKPIRSSEEQRAQYVSSMVVVATAWNLEYADSNIQYFVADGGVPNSAVQ